MAARRGNAPEELTSFYNGRIEAPRIFAAALTPADLERVRSGESEIAGAPLIAAWDFSRDIPTDEVRDTGRFAIHGHTLNLPVRAMTGHAWRGEIHDWMRDATTHGAIHFHDDDLDDARWAPDFEVAIPANLPSAIYAVRLTATEATHRGGPLIDRLPFFVRAPRSGPTQRLLFLQSTNSHLAYANWHAQITEERAKLWGYKWPYPIPPEKRYAIAEEILSLYDVHSDGSGVCYSTIRRPVLNLRPTMNDELSADGIGWAHGVKADLHIAGWLNDKGIGYDVATDEDLHEDGSGLLAGYRVVITGTHPEYWTGPMLDAAEAYVARGGRFVYLGGNGFYWVTSYIKPGVIEVRRWGGTQAWTANIGEYHHASTGEQGGLWRHRGRAPQRLAGIGFTAQGGGQAQPYYRTPASHDPRADWMFEGIADGEPIGAEGLVMNGAAGFEVDRTDAAIGTPPHALVVAIASGFSDSYQHVVEEVHSANSRQGGTIEPRVRAEMTYFEAPNGGAVFSAGSISYGSALPVNNYDNPVSRLTENVIRGFLRQGPLPGAGPVATMGGVPSQLPIEGPVHGD